jgi:hypothetical protein
VVAARQVRDRYDYLYSNDELKEFSETADAARRLVKKLYLYTNNHFSAKSVANAAMIKQQLASRSRELPSRFRRTLSGAGRRGRRQRADVRSTPIRGHRSRMTHAPQRG